MQEVQAHASMAGERGRQTAPTPYSLVQRRKLRASAGANTNARQTTPDHLKTAQEMPQAGTERRTHLLHGAGSGALGPRQAERLERGEVGEERGAGKRGDWPAGEAWGRLQRGVRLGERV